MLVPFLFGLKCFGNKGAFTRQCLPFTSMARSVLSQQLSHGPPSAIKGGFGWVRATGQLVDVTGVVTVESQTLSIDVIGV